LYLDWITALTIDQPGFDNNIYGFSEIDARMSQYYSIGQLPIINKTITPEYYGFNIFKLISPPNNLSVQIRKPRYHAVGISLATLDTDGWRVTKSLNREIASTISVNLTGSSMDEAYLIISYISRYTPTSPRWENMVFPAPATNLNVTITEMVTSSPTITTLPSSLNTISTSSEISSIQPISTPGYEYMILIITLLTITFSIFVRRIRTRDSP